MTGFLNQVLNIINPPVEINSFDDVAGIVRNPAIHSLCERPFFIELERLFQQFGRNRISGDVLQVGVWRGGTAVFLKALIDQYLPGRNLYLIDTFHGFIKEQLTKPKDLLAVEEFSTFQGSAFSEDDMFELLVKCNVSKKGVIPLKGDVVEMDFSMIENKQFCLLHVDVDFYEPTYATLKKYYPHVIDMGRIIIDDYGVKGFNCKGAVQDYFHSIDTTPYIDQLTKFVACIKK